MTVAISHDPQKGFLEIDITGVASTDNAGIGEILNPEGVDLLITRSYAYFATGSTGAANLGVGVADSGAAGSDILSAFDVIQATVGGKAFYCQAVPVNETELAVIWEDDEYVTFTGSATTVGLAGKLFLEYIRLD